MEVLMSAVRWLMHDWNARKQYMLDVVKCVRFGLIAPWQLVDVKRNPENPEFMELMSYPEIQKMVDDGLACVFRTSFYMCISTNYKIIHKRIVCILNHDRTGKNDQY